MNFSTAYPAVHRNCFSLNLYKTGISGKLWRIQTCKNIFVRILRPIIPENEYKEVLRGFPQGSRLSPTLFGILIAELLQEFKQEHLNCDTIGPDYRTWVGALDFVDDLVLLSHIPDELQEMINTVSE